ncbi:1,4-alpha-glucan branching enzyme [uncultured Gammaproteobacteria bacterium]
MVPVPPPDAAAIVALIRAEHGDPFSVLGMHQVWPNGPVTVSVLWPGAEGVDVIDAGSGFVAGRLERLHPDGFFHAVFQDRRHLFAYRLRLYFSAGLSEEIEDAYRFPSVLGELDVHLLAEGNHLRAFERMGAHPQVIDEVPGTAFAVWAPEASRVSVVGDFCAWDGRRLPMRRRVECGVWEIFVPGVGPGTRYKFEIRATSGEILPLKVDPFAFEAEPAPGTASVVSAQDHHHWHDGEWLARRAVTDARATPMVIYEVHLGSWRRVPEQGDRYLTYRELTEQLVPYVRDLGFTHIELLPITEHPFDGSWGYQPIGLYAPTRRHGSPEEFRRFVEACHHAGIGVLLDWVPGHFPTDAHGLAQFDGSHLYEHADPRQGFQPDWNTLVYNFGRREVANFLLGSALFWLDRYHLDGVRVDAVASMLYLDYSRKDGEWIANRHGGKENLEAIDFLKRMNELVHAQHPGAITIAEESTAWPGVSRPTYVGGLGFTFKWSMGWMHDSLRYFGKDSVHRRYHHHDLTFALLYQYSENYVLPLSHDEVVHGKGSLFHRMPGDRWRKFANLRAYYGFMYTHPGKKLLFMGGELAQEREWNHDTSLDWHLLDDDMNAGIQRLVKDLNWLYRSLPALHELDCEPGGFEWIEANDSENSVLAYLRRGHDHNRPVITVGNFTPLPHHGYRVGVPLPGWYSERLNTDSACYGGTDDGNGGGVVAEPVPWHGREWSITLVLPPLATLVLERQEG